MNFGEVNLLYDEIEISVKRIVQNCRKSFKGILIASVIFAIVFSGIMYIKDMMDSKDKMPQEYILTDGDEIVVNKFLLLKGRIDEAKSYKENALAMKLDCANVYRNTSQYYVKADESIASDVAWSIYLYSKNAEFKNAFSELVGVESAAFAEELYDVSVQGLEERIVSISVIANSEEECIKYKKAIEIIIYSYSEKMINSIGDNSLELISESMRLGFSHSLYDLQRNYYTSFETINTEYKNILTVLTSAQKNAIMDRSEMVFEGVETEVAEVQFSIKYLLLGFLVGVVVSILYISGKTLIDGKLQSRHELKKRFNITNFGAVDSKSTKEHFEWISLLILKSMANEDLAAVDFVGTIEQEELIQLDEISSIMRTQRVQCGYLGNVLNEKDTVTKLNTDRPIIIVEKIGKTRVADVYNEMSMYKTMGIRILGYICIDE